MKKWIFTILFTIANVLIKGGNGKNIHDVKVSRVSETKVGAGHDKLLPEFVLSSNHSSLIFQAIDSGSDDYQEKVRGEATKDEKIGSGSDTKDDKPRSENELKEDEPESGKRNKTTNDTTENKNKTTDDTTENKNETTNDTTKKKNDTTGNKTKTTDDKTENETTDDKTKNKNETTDDTTENKNETMNDTTENKNETTDDTTENKNETKDDTTKSKNKTTDDTIENKNKNGTTDNTTGNRNKTRDDTTENKNETRNDTTENKSDTRDDTTENKNETRDDTTENKNEITYDKPAKKRRTIENEAGKRNQLTTDVTARTPFARKATETSKNFEPITKFSISAANKKIHRRPNAIKPRKIQLTTRPQVPNLVTLVPTPGWNYNTLASPVGFGPYISTPNPVDTCNKNGARCHSTPTGIMHYKVLQVHILFQDKIEPPTFPRTTESSITTELKTIRAPSTTPRIKLPKTPPASGLVTCLHTKTVYGQECKKINHVSTCKMGAEGFSFCDTEMMFYRDGNWYDWDLCSLCNFENEDKPLSTSGHKCQGKCTKNWPPSKVDAPRCEVENQEIKMDYCVKCGPHKSDCPSDVRTFIRAQPSKAFQSAFYSLSEQIP